MKRVLVSERARVDLFELVEHIAGDQPSAAHRLLDEALDAFKRLAEYPEIGRVRTSASFAGEVRWWVLPRFRMCIIVYRNESEAVEVLRVLHAARDVDARTD